MIEKENSLQSILDKTIDGKMVFGTSFGIKKDDFTWFGASGNLSIEQSYFIASTTKLFTTAIILYLKSEGKLQLEDKISIYLDWLIIFKEREVVEKVWKMISKMGMINFGLLNKLLKEQKQYHHFLFQV